MSERWQFFESLLRKRQLINKALGRAKAAARYLVDPNLILASAEDETSILFRGDPGCSEEALRVRNCFHSALALNPDLPDRIIRIQGMSGRKYRRFINNLVRDTPGAAYLEIGSWAGSTMCAAIAGNKVRALGIDNWSLYGGPKAEFKRNIGSVLTEDTDFEFIEADFRSVNYRELGAPFNIYLYDGPHKYQDQYDGVVLAQPALTDTFVLIMDDWNYPKVRKATHDAFVKLAIEVPYYIEIRTNQADCTAMRKGWRSDWHNGYFFAVCKKAGCR
jgi:hypothetical protein